jgi:hypothetical protein
MQRRGSGLLVAAVVVCGLIGPGAVAGNAEPASPFPATSTNCTMSGRIQYVPPLKTVAQTVTVSIKWKYFNCTGSTAGITSGATASFTNELRGGGTLSCGSVFNTPGLPILKGRMTWTPASNGVSTEIVNAGMKPRFTSTTYAGSLIGGTPAGPVNGNEHVTLMNGNCSTGVGSENLAGTGHFFS